jgi:hypothetical protein
MVFFNHSRILGSVIAAAVVISGVTFASAQEISESHLKAARAAITATHATDSMDSILPEANQMLKVEMIQKNPDREAEIVQFIDDETIALVPRRGDLEKEVALVFAKIFTEQELNEIAAFHNSTAGKKFISETGIVGREIEKAVNIWQIGIARDLSQNVAKKLAETAPAPAQPAAQDGAAPAAPAPEAPKQ